MRGSWKSFPLPLLKACKLVESFALFFLLFTTADSRWSSLRYGKHFRIIIKVLKLANPLNQAHQQLFPRADGKSAEEPPSRVERGEYLKNISFSTDSNARALFPPSAFENYSANTRKKRRAFSELMKDQRSAGNSCSAETFFARRCN